MSVPGTVLNRLGTLALISEISLKVSLVTCTREMGITLIAQSDTANMEAIFELEPSDPRCRAHNHYVSASPL